MAELSRSDLFTTMDAVDALDWLLEKYPREVQALVRKKSGEPDIMTRDGLTKLSARIATSIRGLTGKAEAQALKAALAPLNADWASLPDGAREKVLQSAKRALRANLNRLALPKVEETFRIGIKSAYKNSKYRYIGQHKLDIPLSLSSLDKRIAEHIAGSTANFVRSEYGKRSESFSKRVRKVVAEGAKRGAGPKEIVADLRDKISDLGKLGRGDFYWEVASLAFVNRARNYAAVSSMKDAGYSVYIWESTLDEVTTETCRFLHGKRFPVDGALETFERAEKAENPEDLKIIQPWISHGVNEDGKPALFARGADGNKIFIADVLKPGVGVSDRIGTYNQRMTDVALLGNGFSLPPIHGLCRSIVLPDVVSAPRTTVDVAPPPKPPRTRKPIPKPKQAKLPEKGVHFRNYYSDMDPELEREILSTFDEIGAEPFLKKNPFGRLVFTSVKQSGGDRWNLPSIKSGTNGLYYPAFHGHQILKVLTDRKADRFSPNLKPDSPVAFSVSSTMKSKAKAIKATLIHEFGHHVHLHDKVSKTPLFKRVDDVVRGAFVQSKFDVRAKRALPVTRYSEQDPDEFFAESFAFHAIDPKALQAKNPAAFEMVEEVRRLRGLKPPKGDRLKDLGKSSRWSRIGKN